MTQLDEKALSVGEFASSYEWESEDGSYTPNDQERAMIEDAIEGYISQATQAGESKAVAWRYMSDFTGKEHLTKWLVTNDKRLVTVEKDRLGNKVEPLYAAPPSFEALQADNERLREDKDRILKQLERVVNIAEARLILLVQNNLPDITDEQ